MKTKLLVITLAIAGIHFAGCDKDDDNILVTHSIEANFRSQYPDAARVGWESKNDYYVAGFQRNNTEAEAWYNTQGKWQMTETDVRYTDLPQAVKTAFEQSEYPKWHIDDIDMLEYPDREAVYIIEVEQGNAEYDLWFSPDGVLVKSVPDSNNNNGSSNGNNSGSEHRPTTVIPTVKTFITEKYPQARIVDIENEHGMLEIDIVDGYTPRELIFSQSGEWVCTKTEIRKADIPVLVLNAVSASQYSSWRIDDIDHYVTPTNEYYLLELEYGKSETNLKIDVNGNIL
ncbi:MAG: PepSY-like domain-containing protein [Bacteroidales bacterium]|jgi:hypothetical protein|nr:PepSY-like domain-containing protein [Bacteroidales bacterium]